MYDKAGELGNLTNDKYQELLDLCKEQKIYVVKTVEKIDVPEGITIIDFYPLLKENRDYTVRESNYLSESGNNALNELINSYFNQEEAAEEVELDEE